MQPTKNSRVSLVGKTLLCLVLATFAGNSIIAQDISPQPGGPTHFFLWFDYNVLGKSVVSKGRLPIGGKVVNTLYVMEGKSLSGGSGGGERFGRYFNHRSDLILELPDATMTGEDVLAHLDDLIDPEGPLAFTTEFVIDYSARTASGGALTILYHTPNGSHRGKVSLTVSETRDRKAILTTHLFEVLQTEANR